MPVNCLHIKIMDKLILFIIEKIFHCLKDGKEWYNNKVSDSFIGGSMKNIKRLFLLLLSMLLIFVACGQPAVKEKQTDKGENIEIKAEEKNQAKNSEENTKEIETKNQAKDKPEDNSSKASKTKILDQDKRTIYLSIGQLDENKAYYSMEDVAGYLLRLGKLPKNYLTKRQAMDKGWDSGAGNLWDVTDKGVIGGDNFGNREGKLPKKSGRRYFEADVNYKGGRRNAHRLVFTNDRLVFYTSNHYKSFKLVKEQ